MERIEKERRSPICMDDAIKSLEGCIESIRKVIKDNTSDEREVTLDNNAIEEQKKMTTYKTEKYIIILGGVATAAVLIYFYISIYYSLSFSVPEITNPLEGISPNDLVHESKL